MGRDYEKRADPLRHSRLRLGRARKRFIQLGKEVVGYVEGNQPRLDRRFDSATGWTSYNLQLRGGPRKQLAEGAGIICEDLRIALDLLVGALRNGDQADTQPPRFPICLTIDDYLGKKAASGQRQRLLRGLASPDLALIDALQPYHRVDPAKDPLAQLQAVYDRYTKKELRGALVVSDVPSAEFEELESRSVRKAETRRCHSDVTARDNLEVLAYRIWPDPKARLKVDISVRFDLRFDPPGLTMSDLDRIRAQVEKTVRSFDTRLASVA